LLDSEVVDEALVPTALADDEAVIGAQRNGRLRIDQAAQELRMQIDHVLGRAPEHRRIRGVLLPPLLHDRRCPERIVRGKRSDGHLAERTPTCACTPGSPTCFLPGPRRSNSASTGTGNDFKLHVHARAPHVGLAGAVLPGTRRATGDRLATLSLPDDRVQEHVAAAAADFLVTAEQPFALEPGPLGGPDRAGVPRLDVQLDPVQRRYGPSERTSAPSAQLPPRPGRERLE
jgi:hypothetical protein